MEFATIAEAFNHYRSHTLEQIESRAKEIGTLIDRDPEAKIEKLNIELDGLKEARANIEQRSAARDKVAGWTPITGASRDFAVTDRMPEDVDVFSAPEYRTAFFKNLLGQDMTEIESRIYTRAQEVMRLERRADAFTTTTSGAAVLPTATLDEIVSKARTQGGLLPVCRQFALPSNLSVPVGTPSTKAAWHVEGAPVEAEAVAPRGVSFGAFEIVKIFSLSAAAKRMSIQAFESYIVNELSACVMETIGDAIVNGTGIGQGTGILPGITWDADNSFTFTGAPEYTDFTGMLAMLKRGYSAGAKFAMNNATLYNLVYGLVDGQGRPLFINDAKTEGIGYILGRPIVVDDNIPDDVLLAGDFNYYGVNIPEGILIEVSRESSFKSGRIDYRSLAIADCKPLVPEAFVKLSRAEG